MASVRERVQGQARQIRRLKAADRAAAVVISLGGLAVMLGVAGILVFILVEAAPLFGPASGRLLGVVHPAPAPALPLPGEAGEAVPPPSGPPLLLGADEYRTLFYLLGREPRVDVHDLATGSWQRGFPLVALAGRRVLSASRSDSGDRLAAGSDRGQVALATVRFRPRYEGSRRAGLDVEVVEDGLVAVDPARRDVRRVSALQDPDGGRAVAALVAPGEIALWAADPGGGERRHLLALPAGTGETVTALRLGRGALLAGTDQGRVYRWDVAGEPRLTSASPVGGPVTALAFSVGGTTLLAPASSHLTGWFPARLREEDDEPRMVRGHAYPPQRSPVVLLAPAQRDRTFAAFGEDGSLAVRHATSERTLLELPPGPGASRPAAALMAARNDGVLLAREDGSVVHHEVSLGHPEVTWGTLFRRVWYEGYARPEHVWQSTGASADFEPKLGLVPLVFGTLKATFYALAFAVPLAVLGALFTSQFAHPSLRNRVKPTIEIMAALPSVVIGFVAGLWLAPAVERSLLPVLLAAVFAPALGTAGVLLWDRLPRRLVRRARAGSELALVLPLLLLGGLLALLVGPVLERALFAGDLRLWLGQALALTYDQRNSIVVGLAMGFAVIPIIFTIADDAFVSVPASLTAASLAVGASRWQTALRVVLPTASPGVFSAVMVGFGRAVGETMIVLMATGNTPVIDWSPFNGMRTLSANIAVEMPEAPVGGSLYRVLFLAGALLFALTFAVNTAAELVRQRLRERYRAL